MRNFRAKKDGLWVHGDLTYDWSVVNKETIGQFTGLNDHNKTPIYEGDILYIADEYRGQFDYRFEPFGIIEWESEMGGFICKSISPKRHQDYEKLDCDIAFTCKVVGNIYDNKDLLV